MLTSRRFDLVALDLDGTILDLYHASSITPPVLAAIAQVQAAGVAVTIATGRVFDYVRAYIQPLNITTPVVTTQGAVIGDPTTGHVIAETPLSLPMARDLAAWADAAQRVSAFYFNDDEGHTHIRQNIDMGRQEFFDHVMGSPREIVGSLSSLLDGRFNHPPLKYMMFSDMETEPALVDELKARFGASATVTRTHPLLVEMTALGVDKGQGLLRLCQLLGVAPQRVLAIGDNDNDIPLLQTAGFGVAMGNSSAGLKAVADWIAPPIEEDGAAVALRRLVLGQPDLH